MTKNLGSIDTGAPDSQRLLPSIHIYCVCRLKPPAMKPQRRQWPRCTHESRVDSYACAHSKQDRQRVEPLHRARSGIASLEAEKGEPIPGLEHYVAARGEHLFVPGDGRDQ